MKENELKFHDVYDEFYSKIRHYLERLVGKNEAEDLTQEVFVKVNKALAGFEGKSKLSTWIYRVATNAALDKLKSRAFRDGKQKVTLGGGAKEGEDESQNIAVEAKSLSAERKAIRKEMNECIREFVGRLPIDYRTVIILSEMKDLKNQEIADILGVSLDTTKIRLHRARLKLKEIFEQGCAFYHDESGKLACDRKQQKSENRED